MQDNKIIITDNQTKTKTRDIITVTILLAMLLATSYIISLNDDAIRNPTTHWTKP
jgi:hypothetical protein